jgi:hypothetical protein
LSLKLSASTATDAAPQGSAPPGSAGSPCQQVSLSAPPVPPELAELLALALDEVPAPPPALEALLTSAVVVAVVAPPPPAPPTPAS